MRRALPVAFVWLAAVAACSSPSPVLYTIAPVPGPPQTGGPKVVALQQISVARFLERSQIVRSSENYRLDVMSNDWWGEPVGAMLSRVLVEELGQRLPQSTVIGESGAVTASPDATIELNLQRLDEDASGNLVLQAQASVSFKGRGRAGIAQLPLCGDPAGAGCTRVRSRLSAPQSANSPTVSRRCWAGGGDAILRRPAADATAAARMPGLRAAQTVPALAPGMTAQCVRCPTTLRRTSSHRLDHMIALTVAAFVLLLVMCSTNINGAQTSKMYE